MKKNLCMLALGLLVASPASAAPALFTAPAETNVRENVTCSAGTLTGAHGSLYSRQSIYNISHFRKSNAATTAIAITVDISAAAKVTEPTKLLTIDSTHELGLMATPDGITGNWHGSPWGDSVSYTALAAHPATFRRDGVTYISFTVVVSGCCGSGWNGIGGIMGYDTNGDLIINYPLLASAENKDFKSISANLDIVKSISISPDVSRSTAQISTDAAKQARKIERKFLKTRGEWLSPTAWVFTGIGLMALLAGISIICFRKGKWA
jgi:hypothetical protein